MNRGSNFVQEKPLTSAARGLLTWTASVLLLACCVNLQAAVKVYLEPAKAIVNAFPEADRHEKVSLLLNDQQVKQVADALGQKQKPKAGVFYQYWKGDKVLGWSTIQEQMGKHEPMTFQIMLDAQGKILQVRMLIYRESRGGEVSQQRWMKQFRKKSAKDKLRVGRDVVNYSGATISSNAVTKGVKRALLLFPFAQEAANKTQTQDVSLQTQSKGKGSRNTATEVSSP